jgi:hypothetical protein
MIINEILSRYYYIIIILAIFYYILSKNNTSILLSIIIIIIAYYYINNYIKENDIINNTDNNIKKNNIQNEVKDIIEVSNDNLYVNKNNKNIKYLIKNKEFMDILFNIRFIKKFDKTKYSNMIINMDKLMKIYIYILADRYDINTYLPVFTDIKDNIIEIFYSLIFVIPNKFKHIYGFDPQIEIDKSLKDFRTKTKDMITIISNYSRIGKDEAYLNIHKYIPYEKNKEHYLP